VIPLEPEFITPQDGHEQPDRENAAAKRWLGQFGARYRPLGITILGDDLSCKQPVCEAIRQQGLNFILVCQPDSHTTLDAWVAGLAASGDVQTLSIERREGKRHDTDTYRFVSHVPLRNSEDALTVKRIASPMPFAAQILPPHRLDFFTAFRIAVASFYGRSIPRAPGR
jgi:hypothetical protein